MFYDALQFARRKFSIAVRRNAWTRVRWVKSWHVTGVCVEVGLRWFSLCDLHIDT